MSLSQAAYRAAEIAAERGHCKFTEQDEEGHVCLAGAVNLAISGQPKLPLTGPLRDQQFDILRAAGKALLARGYCEGMLLYYSGSSYLTEPECKDGTPVPYAIYWNNLKDITGEDVVLLLKEAGTLLEAEGQ
jgi:hypothetical protein